MAKSVCLFSTLTPWTKKAVEGFLLFSNNAWGVRVKVGAYIKTYMHDDEGGGVTFPLLTTLDQLNEQK